MEDKPKGCIFCRSPNVVEVDFVNTKKPGAILTDLPSLEIRCADCKILFRIPSQGKDFIYQKIGGLDEKSRKQLSGELKSHYKKEKAPLFVNIDWLFDKIDV
jgi:hypothetical protein